MKAAQEEIGRLELGMVIEEKLIVELATSRVTGSIYHDSEMASIFKGEMHPVNSTQACRGMSLCGWSRLEHRASTLTTGVELEFWRTRFAPLSLAVSRSTAASTMRTRSRVADTTPSSVRSPRARDCSTSTRRSG